MNKYTFTVELLGDSGNVITSRLLFPGTSEQLTVDASSVLHAIDRIRHTMEFGPGIELTGLKCSKVIANERSVEYPSISELPAHEPPTGGDREGTSPD